MSKPSISEFMNVIDEIYGVYLDSTYGFKLLVDNIQKIQKKAIGLIGPMATVEELDKRSFVYGKGSPYDSHLLHQTTQGTLKKRNKKNALNYKVMGNLSAVQIYQYWEDKYREEIANSLKKDRDELRSDVFGDLRHYRQAIIHNNGIATQDCEDKVKILRKFKRGEEIFLNEEQIFKIIREVKSYLNSI